MRIPQQGKSMDRQISSLVNFRVIVDPSSLYESEGGIYGYIYIIADDLVFPDGGWFDRAGPILVDWCRKTLHLLEGGQRSEEFWFQGKGNRFTLTTRGERDEWQLDVLTGWPNTRGLLKATVRRQQVVESLIEATEVVAAFARDKGTRKRERAELEGWLGSLRLWRNA